VTYCFILCIARSTYLLNFSQVLDRPDSKPEFPKQYYEKYLPENAAPGLTVVQVAAREPEDPTAVLRYKLDEKATPYFVINERTGLIKTAGDLLDWEVTPVITFPVYAYEIRSPEITGQTTVRVVVSKTMSLQCLIFAKYFAPLLVIYSCCNNYFAPFLCTKLFCTLYFFNSTLYYFSPPPLLAETCRLFHPCGKLV
jgi:hypothetical protein